MTESDVLSPRVVYSDSCAFPEEKAQWKREQSIHFIEITADPPETEFEVNQIYCSLLLFVHKLLEKHQILVLSKPLSEPQINITIQSLPTAHVFLLEQVSMLYNLN